MKKNVASQAIGCQMLTAADGTEFTGSVTVTVTGDNGTQTTGSVGSGACAHEGHGYHSYAPAQAETNFDHVAFTFFGTGAITATVQVYPTFPQTGDNFARLGAPAGASVSADVAAVKVDTAAILVDTGTTLDARIPAALVGGRIDASVGAMAAGVVTAAAVATDAIDADALAANAVTEIQAGLATPTNITAGTITTVTNLTNAPTAGDLTATMKASVNAEVVDVVNVDTYAEPGQEAPGTTVSLARKINYLYKAWRNRHTQTATEYALYADNATTKDQEAVVSDDGTTFDRGEVGTGA